MVTYGNIASIQSQSSMAIGQAQAGSMGLGETEANALGVTNLMGGSDEKEGGLVTKTLEMMNKKEKGGSLMMSQKDQMSVLNAGLGLNKGGIMDALG